MLGAALPPGCSYASSAPFWQCTQWVLNHGMQCYATGAAVGLDVWPAIRCFGLIRRGCAGWQEEGRACLQPALRAHRPSSCCRSCVWFASRWVTPIGAAQVVKCLCGNPAVVRKGQWRLLPVEGGRLTRRYLACARKSMKLRCAFRQYLD